PDRQAGLLHLRPLLFAARGQRLLDRDRPARVERGPPEDPDRRSSGPGLRAQGRDRAPDVALRLVFPRPALDRGGRLPLDALRRAVERLDEPRVPRESSHHRARLRAVSRRDDRARNRPLRLSDPVRSGAPASRLRHLGAISLREGSPAAVRPLQDDGLGDRHLVDPVRHTVGARFPAGRRADGDPGSPHARFARRREAAAPRVLLRVPRPDRARLLAFPGSGASSLRRGARRAIRRRGREIVRDDGRDRRRDRARPAFRRGAARAVRPLRRDVAALGQLRLLARRPGLPPAQGQCPAAEPRSSLFPGSVLGGGRLVEVPRLRDGAGRRLRQPARTRERGDRLSRRRLRAAPEGPDARLARADRSEDGGARGFPRLQEGGRLPALRSPPHSGLDRREPSGLSRVLAGVARGSDRVGLRGQPRRLERRPLLARPRPRSGSLLRLAAVLDVARARHHRRDRGSARAPLGDRCARPDPLEMRATARLATALLFLLPPGASAPAAEPQRPASTADSERQADLKRLRSRIASLEAHLAESRRRQATLSEELSRLDLQLAIAAGEKELLARLREDYAARLAGIGVERKSAEEAGEKSRRNLLARARVLHRFGRFGYLRILLEAKDVPAFVESVSRLDSLARRDARLLTEHRGSQTRLEASLSRERVLKAETDRLYAKSGAEERRIASLRTERENLLARQRTLSDTQRREVATLSDKATRLEGLLERLSQRPEEPVGPAGGIRPWKGVLDWPARGTLSETFGRHRHPKFDAWTQSNGISLALPAATPVRAVFAGKAVYAQWLAEYGNLVIVDH